MNPASILIILCAILSGVLVLALTQGTHATELTRLTKLNYKLQNKNKPVEEINLFTQQRTDNLARLLDTCGLENQYEKIRNYMYMSMAAGGLVVGAGAFYIMPALSIFGFVIGLPLGYFIFLTVLGKMAKERQAKLTAQLPQVLETMVSSLRAGSPVIEVFKVLSETCPEPIRGEFKRGLVSLQLGKPFRESLNEMTTRIKTQDFKLLVTAIFISQDVGGNLANVVAEIAEAIRERFKLRDYMDSLTSQGKATAMFIGALPYLITLLTYSMAPDYIKPFLNNPWCRILLGVGVVWESIGFYILIKMTTFEV